MQKENNITGYGQMKPDQDLAAVGYIALSGTAELAVSGEEELLKRFTPQFVKRCQSIYETEERVRAFAQAGEGILELAGAESCFFAGEGGIMTALWNYFDAFGLGFEMELRRLPLLQETVEVCEVFDVNPYRLQSAGCILLTAQNGGALTERLKKQGIPAVVIGRTSKSIGRRIYNGEIQTFLDRPKPDELYKIQFNRR